MTNINNLLSLTAGYLHDTEPDSAEERFAAFIYCEQRKGDQSMPLEAYIRHLVEVASAWQR